ncbi:MAG: MSHA biogenesis protein MshM [Gammaproteobacteria bacterium]|jgi:MSHA biogenesis protein MshM
MRREADMYEEYFGLKRPPFKITPDTSLFYEGGKRGDILAALVYAVYRGEGIIKVVGEVGSGKTMLCRMLQIKLPNTVEIVYIANPSVSPEDILFVIAHELELPVTKNASKHEVMHLLQDYLLQRHMEDKQVVLFVEEAQGMPLETLEEIRLLSNLETDQNKLLQIILFGQPELDDNLAETSIRQLRERITHHFNLSPLTSEEIHKYLNFRMREVGYTGPELIDQAIAKRVEKYSNGLLRRINIIADKILLSAFAEGTHSLNSKHVMAAVEDSNFNSKESSWLISTWLKGSSVIVLVALVLFVSRPHWTDISNFNFSSFGLDIAQIDEFITDVTLSSNAAIIVEGSVKDGPSIELSEQAQITSGAVNSAEIEPVQLNAYVDEGKAQKAQTFAVSVDTGSSENVQAGIGSLEAEPLAENGPAVILTTDYNQWLNAKLEASMQWLATAERGNVSIQVMMRNKSAAQDLVQYLTTDWPLDLEMTYLYEVKSGNGSIYRVFYSEFESLAQGKSGIEQLPHSVKVNSPYLNSVYRMQKALL